MAPPAAAEGCALVLADVHVLAAAIQLRASGINGDDLLVCSRIAAHGQAAIGLRVGDGILEGNFRFRTRNLPRAGLRSTWPEFK